MLADRVTVAASKRSGDETREFGHDARHTDPLGGAEELLLVEQREGTVPTPRRVRASGNPHLIFAKLASHADARRDARAERPPIRALRGTPAERRDDRVRRAGSAAASAIELALLDHASGPGPTAGFSSGATIAGTTATSDPLRPTVVGEQTVAPGWSRRECVASTACSRSVSASSGIGRTTTHARGGGGWSASLSGLDASGR